MLVAAAVATIGLPPALANRTLDWPGRVERARTSTDELCAAVREADALADALAQPLMDRRDAVFDDPARDEPYRMAVTALDRELVGLSLAVGAETFYSDVAYDELAAATSDSASAALLRATHGLLPGSWPAWMEQTWDLGGCSAPGRAQAPIEALTAAWGAAPACLRDAVRAPIAESLAELARWDCFCEDEPTVRASLRALAPALQALEAAGGPARVEPDPGPDARYSDTCAG